MYKIYKITSNHTVDFAAEELKKYLRMMMPRCGEITIEYAPEATEGFRLGLMQDFGLDTSEAEDTTLDDIIHIDTDECGGIIAGSNVRSVLLAVYRYLTINGCRWLFPGIDGEYIPIKNIEAVSYHKMADCRYRGQCNEGAENQAMMMEEIDFTPKIGMNIFMIEFDIPKVYYNRYYDHTGNESRDPEPITAETVLQWKRQCEAEMSKRGLQFHDMGHGWTAEPFGIDTTDGWVQGKATIPEESKDFVAMIDGERKLFLDTGLNTNFCMSNPNARAKVVKAVADYSELSTNVDYLHVWLADAHNNHCECNECRKKLPSDWYVMLMNEIDEELTKRELATRIVYICYVDTTWAPKTEKIKNPERFSFLVAAISRNYSEPVDPNLDVNSVELKEFDLNKNILPATVNEYIAHADKWLKMSNVNSLVYEYHFWDPQFRDLGVFDSAKTIHEDIKGYRAHGYRGIIEDGSQRSFFPTGFGFYTYASTLFDTSVDFDELVEDHFSHAYGKDWRTVAELFREIGKAIDYRYLIGSLGRPGANSKWNNPELIPSFEKVFEITEKYRPFVEAHKNMPKRAQTVSYRVLARYLDYCDGLTRALILKADEKDKEAYDAYREFFREFGKREIEIERVFDQSLSYRSLEKVFKDLKRVYL